NPSASLLAMKLITHRHLRIWEATNGSFLLSPSTISLSRMHHPSIVCILHLLGCGSHLGNFLSDETSSLCRGPRLSPQWASHRIGTRSLLTPLLLARLLD